MYTSCSLISGMCAPRCTHIQYWHLVLIPCHTMLPRMCIYTKRVLCLPTRAEQRVHSCTLRAHSNQVCVHTCTHSEACTQLVYSAGVFTIGLSPFVVSSTRIPHASPCGCLYTAHGVQRGVFTFDLGPFVTTPTLVTTCRLMWMSVHRTRCTAQEFARLASAPFVFMSTPNPHASPCGCLYTAHGVQSSCLYTTRCIILVWSSLFAQEMF
jgi:hypothetical protein